MGFDVNQSHLTTCSLLIQGKAHIFYSFYLLLLYAYVFHKGGLNANYSGTCLLSVQTLVTAWHLTLQGCSSCCILDHNLSDKRIVSVQAWLTVSCQGWILLGTDAAAVWWVTLILNCVLWAQVWNSVGRDLFLYTVYWLQYDLCFSPSTFNS